MKHLYTNANIHNTIVECLLGGDEQAANTVLRLLNDNLQIKRQPGQDDSFDIYCEIKRHGITEERLLRLIHADDFYEFASDMECGCGTYAVAVAWALVHIRGCSSTKLKLLLQNKDFVLKEEYQQNTFNSVLKFLLH